MGFITNALKNLVKKLIIAGLIVAFFSLGGYTYVKNKLNIYQNPTRKVFIQEEKNYGDFSQVSSDFQLTRSFNIFGYEKVNAKYLPTGQKIAMYDLKNENKIKQEDFKTKKIDEDIHNFISKLDKTILEIKDLEITKRGVITAKNKQVPYVQFDAKITSLPFKKVTGIIICYKSPNKNSKPSTKLLISATDKNSYNPLVVQTFIKSIKL